MICPSVARKTQTKTTTNNTHEIVRFNNSTYMYINKIVKDKRLFVNYLGERGPVIIIELKNFLAMPDLLGFLSSLVKEQKERIVSLHLKTEELKKEEEERKVLIEKLEEISQSTNRQLRKLKENDVAFNFFVDAQNRIEDLEEENRLTYNSICDLEEEWEDALDRLKLFQHVAQRFFKAVASMKENFTLNLKKETIQLLDLVFYYASFEGTEYKAYKDLVKLNKGIIYSRNKVLIPELIEKQRHYSEVLTEGFGDLNDFKTLKRVNSQLYRLQRLLKTLEGEGIKYSSLLE